MGSACPLRAPARWTSIQRTWRMAHAGSPTAPRSLETTSSTLSSPISTCLVSAAPTPLSLARPPSLPHPRAHLQNITCVGCGLCFPPAGSPFSVKVTGEGRVKESITRRRRAPSVANVGSHCDLSLKIPGRNSGEPGRSPGESWVIAPGVSKQEGLGIRVPAHQAAPTYRN